jgi:hypothetical protein
LGKKLFTKRNISKSKTELLDVPELLVLDEGSDDTHLKLSTVAIFRMRSWPALLATPLKHGVQKWLAVSLKMFSGLIKIIKSFKSLI